MHVLIIGNGGREHTIAWKLSQSSSLGKLFIAPGNAGTSQLGTNKNVSVNDFEGIKDIIIKEEIDLVIVGPEVPLVAGIYDFLKSDEETKEVSVIGPSKVAAMLEGSKAFAKEFMAEFNIPTASYKEFTNETMDEGLLYIDQAETPIVLKADGLAAGKGVLILNDKEEAKEELKNMLGGKFGEAGSTVVIESFLDGIEFSMFAITDGKNYKVLPIAKDYKRIGEGDLGLNTGGMGAVSPVPFVDSALLQKVEERIIKPTIAGIEKRGFDYLGFVFFGLIRVGDDPYVIEYNCRLGDPETQVVLPRIQNDLLDILNKTAKGKLDEVEIQIDPRSATAVILVSGGYPEAYEKGKEITSLAFNGDRNIIHAGSKIVEDKILTNGGRVIACLSFGPNFKEALKGSYQLAEQVQFEGKYFRKDIGFDL